MTNRERKIWHADLFDLYCGNIVIFIYARWWHARVARGYLTFADWDHPNLHVGVIREDEIGRAAIVSYVPVEASPHVVVGDPVSEKELLGRIAFVRFGRVPGWNEGCAALVDSMDTGRRCVGYNYDDANGLDPSWPLAGPPLSEPVYRTLIREEWAAKVNE